MTAKYYIILKDGIDKTDLFSSVTSVVNEMEHRPHMFVANCTINQRDSLRFTESVKSVLPYEDSSITENQTIQKSVSYDRHPMKSWPPAGKFGPGTIYTTDFPTGSGYPVSGNWGLLRHISPTNNIPYNADGIGTYTAPSHSGTDYDGTGVDIILNIDSIINITDSQFQDTNPNNGAVTSRIQQFQWNTLTGMSGVSTVNYSSSNISEHSEAVAYITASNTYGWATGANLYLWPRDQLNGFSGMRDNGWDCFKLFHQNKGNSRPTIVIDTIQSIAETLGSVDSKHSALMFRNYIYTAISPGGVDPFPLIYWKQYNSMGGSAYGYTQALQYNGKIVFAEGDFDTSTLSDGDRLAIKNKIENTTNYDIYATHHQPIEQMVAAGVHHISAAGNYQTTTTIPNDADFNNGSFESNGWVQNSLGDYIPFNRTSYIGSGDTILVGALSSQFDPSGNYFSGKETLAEFSCRGDRVDCVAAGQNIFLTLKTHNKYNATGTSFASPQIGGMAALILQKFPTTTPRQLRKYFREVAKGTDTLYSSGMKQATGSAYGDVAYFQDAAGGRGYSGNIAYLNTNADLWANPTELSNDAITSSITEEDNKLNFTIAEINAKLGSV